jgi:putative tryptophan/tyrosine transport system substrate-binding protein
MRRREFITALSVAATWPFVARAQQPLPVIGYLGTATPAAWKDRLEAFRRGLAENGFIAGRDVVIEYRWADNDYDRLQTLAADLVSRGVNVIVAPASAPAALAAQAATKSIPIAFETGADPIAIGLVASLNRPGGNITGITSLNSSLGPKRLEILREAVPSAKLVAVLVNLAAGQNAERQKQDLVGVARSLGSELLVLQASTDRDLEPAFETMLREHVGGLVIASEAFFNSRREQLAAQSLRHAVPAIFQSHDFVAAGGLISYGGDIAESHRLLGQYAGRILKGEKPADLPVQQSTKVELIINLKTAKALGVNIPLTLLGRADEVIE